MAPLTKQVQVKINTSPAFHGVILLFWGLRVGCTVPRHWSSCYSFNLYGVSVLQLLLGSFLYWFICNTLSYFLICYLGLLHFAVRFSIYDASIVLNFSWIHSLSCFSSTLLFVVLFCLHMLVLVQSTVFPACFTQLCKSFLFSMWLFFSWIYQSMGFAIENSLLSVGIRGCCFVP